MMLLYSGKKKYNRFAERQNEVAILFVTSYNCIFCCQSMPVQILDILRLDCTSDYPYEGKRRYR